MFLTVFAWRALPFPIYCHHSLTASPWEREWGSKSYFMGVKTEAQSGQRTCLHSQLWAQSKSSDSKSPPKRGHPRTLLPKKTIEQSPWKPWGPWHGGLLHAECGPERALHGTTKAVGSSFTSEETVGHRTWPRTHSWEVAELGLQPQWEERGCRGPGSPSTGQRGSVSETPWGEVDLGGGTKWRQSWEGSKFQNKCTQWPYLWCGVKSG